MSSSTRLNTLDGVRGLVALVVMLMHFTQHTGHPIFASASLAVDLFFCLSGFFVVYSYRDRFDKGMTLSEFLRKRLVRLYPVYLVGATLGVISLTAGMITGHVDLSVNQALTAVGMNFLYLPYLGDSSMRLQDDRIQGAIFPINHPAWSLFFILAVSTFFCMLLRVPNGKRAIRPIACIAAVSLLAYVLFYRHVAPGWGASNFMGGFPRAIYGFVGGVLVHQFISRIGRPAVRINPVWIYSSLIGLFLLPSIRVFSQLLWIFGTLVLVPIVVGICAVSESGNSTLRSLSDYLGWLSYPLYCLHFPILVLYTVITNNEDAGFSGTLICALLTVLAAHMTCKYIDEPVRRKLEARSRASRPRIATIHSVR